MRLELLEDEEAAEETEAQEAERAASYDRILEQQYVRLPTGLLLDRKRRKLSYRAIYLYGLLLAKQGRNRSLHWGIKSLALLSGLSETGVKEVLAELVESGHIRRKPGSRTKKTFCVTKVEADAETTRIFVRGELVASFASKASNRPSRDRPASRATKPVIQNESGACPVFAPEDFEDTGSKWAELPMARFDDEADLFQDCATD